MGDKKFSCRQRTTLAAAGATATGTPTGAAEEHKKTDWAYKSTIKQEYGLTDTQINKAVEAGLVKSREVPNPHYHSGPPSTLLLREDVAKNVEQIRALQKFTEGEKAQRQRYQARTKLRDKLEFHCPRCKADVRARTDSQMFESLYHSGHRDERVDGAREALMIAHYRHEHTEYEAELEQLRQEQREDWQLVEEEADYKDVDPERMQDEQNDQYQQLKDGCNDEARQLLTKDGLLKEKTATPPPETVVHIQSAIDGVNAALARLEAIVQNSQAEGKLMAEAALAHFRKASAGMSREQTGALRKALKKRKDEDFLKGIMGLIGGFAGSGLDVGKKGRRRK